MAESGRRSAIAIEDFRALPLLEALSDEQLNWVVERATEHSFEPGEYIFTYRDFGEALWILLEGEWRLRRRVDGIDMVVVTTDQRGTWAGGIPVVEGDTPVTAEALRPSRLLRLTSEDVRVMLTSGFPIAPHLLAGIRVGIRNFEQLAQQHEKLAALGKLAAGLAHELNNPAAAIGRAAAQLRETLQRGQLDVLELVLNGETGAQRQSLATIQHHILTGAARQASLDPLDRADLEDAVAMWLEQRGVEHGWDAAAALVAAGLDTEWLDELAAQFPQEVLPPIIRWSVETASTAQLLTEIEGSAGRMSELVGAIKSYAYMDRAPLQEIDVHQGIEDTLLVLQHKLKSGVTVHREFDRSLPRIVAHGGELNQVWTNLIDNAIDAMEGHGHLWIRTRRDGDDVLVEIADDGPGIPPEIQSRIFEPFFTTKDVGQGTGLGLDIAYRIVVTRHGGELRLVSQPGNTCFQVRLPISSSVAADT